MASTGSQDIPRSHSPSSHSHSHSLAAAAALNAGLQNEESRRSSSGSLRSPRNERRRSSIRMSINLNDPSIPGPGELQMSPGASRSGSTSWPANPSHHQRTPSLGELHQELENEQELQVNRLLNMIRQQQAQIQALQAQAPPTATGTTAIDDSTTPTSERSMSLPHAAPTTLTSATSQPIPVHQPSSGSRPRSPFVPHSLSRQSSYRSGRSSHTGSPSLHPNTSHPHGSISGEGGNELILGPPASTAVPRDESAFYQAETQMLTRENQMLKHRIRELERQLNDMNTASPATHSPTTASNLVAPPLNSEEAGAGGAAVPASST